MAKKKKKKKVDKVIKVVCKCHNDFHCPKKRRCHSLCDRFHCGHVCDFRPRRHCCHDFHHCC